MLAIDDRQSIPNETVLLRVLIAPNWWHPRDFPQRPSSLAFLDSNRENSCFILEEANLEALANRFDRARFGTVTAGSAREFNYSVLRDDEGGDGLPGHVLLGYNKSASEKQYRKDAERLAKTGKIFMPPIK